MKEETTENGLPNYKSLVLPLCRELHLSGMKSRYEEVCNDPVWEQLPSEQQFYDLLNHEKLKRSANTVLRLRRQSNLPSQLQAARFELIYSDNRRKWDKKIFNLISEGSWMTRESPADLVISGPCGVGKSYVAACCANKMIDSKQSAYFVRAGRLFTDLRIHQANNTIEKRKSELKKVGVLVLDDFLIEDLSEADCADLLDIINERIDVRTTIFTSQFKLDGWLERLGNTPLTQAVIDRIRHSAYMLDIQGPSQRKTVQA